MAEFQDPEAQLDPSKPTPAPRQSSNPGMSLARIAGANTPDSILQMQRTIGNRAVGQQLFGQKVPGAGQPAQAQPKAQAAPAAPTFPFNLGGLETSQAIQTYAQKALALAKANPKMTFDVFAQQLGDIINQDEFKPLGIPALTIDTQQTLKTQGEWDTHTWTLKVDIHHFSPSATTVGKLTQSEIIEAMDTMYHESRHAEQDFVVMRLLAGQNKSEADIIKALKLQPQAAPVAKEAIQQKLTPTAQNQQLVADAQSLFDTVHGLHNDFLMYVEFGEVGGTVVFGGVGGINDTYNHLTAVNRKNLSAVASEIDGLMQDLVPTSKSFIQPKIAKVAAITNPSPTDTAIDTALNAMDQALPAADAAWKLVGTPPSFSKVKAFASFLLQLLTAYVAGYDSLPGETDAFAVGDEFKRVYKANSAPKKKAPPQKQAAPKKP